MEGILWIGYLIRIDYEWKKFIISRNIKDFTQKRMKTNFIRGVYYIISYCDDLYHNY
jgi:hypothetical protein